MAQNTPGKQLFDLLVTRGFEPEILDSSGKPAPTAEDAEIYSFEFITSNGTNHGTVVAMLGDDKQLELFSGDNVGRGMDSEDKTEWYEFQHQLKNFATKNFMTFGSQNINRLKYSMQGQAALKEGLFESWNGTKNISWNGGPDSVRLMIRHKRPMGVNEARFRQVESLFLETAEGERYKLPFRNLAGGRAMVEHVRQGGRPYDMRGQHIANMVEELNVLSRFRRASHGRVFEGDTANLVSETNVYHATMSRTLKGLASSRGYNNYFESWNPADITEQDLIIEDIKTLFVQETIDSRIEQALPILARIQQQGTAMKEANIFEAWAENLLEGTWATPNTPEQQQELIALLSQELPVGADATNATEQLYSLVGDDILFDQLQDLAEQDPNADCRSLVIARIKDMSDNGFDDFDTVLDALKSEQLATAAPAAPVAEQDDEEYSVDGGMNNELLQDGMLGSVFGSLAGAALTKSPGGAMIGAKLGSAAQDAFGEETDGSCNYTAEGEHCPEHGLMECGSMYEDEQDTISRLRELSGMKNSQTGAQQVVAEGSEQIDELSPGTLNSYANKARAQVRASPGANPNNSHLPTDPKIANRARGAVKADNRLNGFGPVKKSTQGVAEGADDKFSVADKVDELVNHYKLFDKRGWTDLFAKLAGRKLAGAEIYREMEYASKFLQLLDSIRMRSDYRGQQDPKKDQELIDLSNQWLDLFNTATGEYKAMSGQGVIEGAGYSVDGGMANELLQDDEQERDKHYYQRNKIWRVMDGDDLVQEYTPDRYEVVGAKKLLARFDDEGYDVTHVISPIGTVTYLYGKPEDDMDEEVAVTTGNPPLEETVSLKGQYGHSGKLQKFDDVEQDVLQRLRQLSGMIRS